MRCTKSVFTFLTLFAALTLSTAGLAQTLTGNITVRAQDASGAVIPGVEVSISSPSMIGGARKETTDETGAYRFTLLPPGTYRVTFVLPGFKTLNVDGVLLTAGSTATTVGTLEVASTAEEVTITSQAPTIDLESASVGVNISQKMMDEIPWSRSLTGMSMMIPGVFSTSFDVGNSNFGTTSTIQARSGGRSGGNVVTIDGLVWCQTYSDYGSFEQMNVSTNAKGADQMNSGITLAMVVKNGGNEFHGNATAKYQNGSMQSNNVTTFLVPREVTGGNPIRRGLVAGGFPEGSNKYTHFDDFYGDIGGPILKDKLWFYGAWRQGYQGEFRPGFRTAVGGDLTDFYTKLYSPTAKLTYQLTENQKIEAYVSTPKKSQPFRDAGALRPKEATQNQDTWNSQGPMLTYTNIINSKTSLTAKITRGGYWWPAYTYGFDGPGFDGLGPNIAQRINGQLVIRRLPTMDWLGVKNVGVRINDNTSGATDGGFNSNYQRPIRWQESADLSRFAKIFGKTHELKGGYLGWWDKDYTINFGYPFAQQYIYRSTATDKCVPEGEICSELFKNPYRVTVYDYPNNHADGAKYRSAYGNDKITVNRKLTVNFGLRWDWATSWLPTQENDGTGPWARNFRVEKANYILNPARDANGNITGAGEKAYFPVYTLWSPRLSFAYDVFGNGKIAIKGSWGRYVGVTSGVNSQPGPGENSGNVNPMSTTSCTYNNWDGTIPWDAKSKGFGPDGIMGTADDINLNAACGQTAIVNGQTLASRTYNFDPKLRPTFVSEFTAGLEIGLNRDYSIRVNIQRKFDRNDNRTVNVRLPYAAYSEITSADDPGRDGLFCAGSTFTSPGAKTLPCGNGVNYDADNNPLGRLYYYSIPSSNAWRNITDVLYAATDRKAHEGNDSYTGYTFTFSKNYSNRWQLVTSYDIDLSHSVPTNPLTPNDIIANAKAAPTVWRQSFKTSGSYGLPDIPLLFGFKLSGVQYAASFIAQSGEWYGRSAQVDDIRGSAQSLTVEAQWGRFPAPTVWDQSIRKKFRLGETKQTLEFTWELFNSLNSNTVQSWRSTVTGNSNYLQPDGITALRPATILQPRIYGWGVTYKF